MTTTWDVEAVRGRLRLGSGLIMLAYHLVGAQLTIAAQPKPGGIV